MRIRLSVLALALAVSGTGLGQTYTINTFAGGGLPENVPAASASFGWVWGAATDAAGNVYFADSAYNVVWRRDSAGMLRRVAGNGTIGDSGDNGPATNAQLNLPYGVAVDAAGNLYIADCSNNRIRRVSNGVITTVAGNGTRGYSGDNGLATEAQLAEPSGIAVDSAGNLYIADQGNHRIRKVSNGLITTVAGSWRTGYSGDNGSATNAALSGPQGVAVDSAGNLYIADTENRRVRKVSNGLITTVTQLQLPRPQAIAVDSAGTLYITAGNYRILKVSNGEITAVAGNGSSGYSGDNGPATDAQLCWPSAVAVDSAADLYIADGCNNRLRMVSNGVITTIAGTGTVENSGDNGPATGAQLFYPGASPSIPSGIYTLRIPATIAFAWSRTV